MKDAPTNAVSNRPAHSGEDQGAQDSDPHGDGEGPEHVLATILVDIGCIDSEEHVFTCGISRCVIIGKDDGGREQAAGGSPGNHVEQLRHRHLLLYTRIHAVSFPRIYVGLILHVLYNLGCDEPTDAATI